nr:radical SAM family heme chaperone HemW [Pseudoruegeria sp. SK021]
MTDFQDWQAGGFGLYLHWPFCAAKCPYCDFNSHVVASIDHERWTRAYLAELRRNAALTQGRTLRSVFFGGGTPSLMTPDAVGQLIAEIRRLWPVANDLEITLEANPTSIEIGKFQGFRDAGVSRISVGIQSLIDDDLRRLGRLHTATEARKALDIARSTFDRVSFDLIYARQGQTFEGWRRELTEALAMQPDHLSMYQLTVEAGTAFGDRHARGLLRDLPDESLSADLYDLTQSICNDHGLPAYEVSNHARDGSESRHNLIYWRYGDYIGIGPGAHGRLTLADGRYATETHLAPTKWLQDVEIKGNGESLRTRLSADDQAAEYLMMSLRLSEGSDVERLKRLGHVLPHQRLIDLEELGLVTRNGSQLQATQAGRMVLNAILRDLLSD